MLDPFQKWSSSSLQTISQSISRPLNLPALPHHVHELLFAICLYSFVNQVVSPLISTYLFPRTYSNFNRRTKISWDIHVTGFLQSCLITAFSLYVIFNDEERQTWRDADHWEKRIWGYTGLTGLLQSFALGFFLWDLYITIRYVSIFGVGMIVHAVASATMFTFGFRPFIHFWCPVFLLHELSTPFLNIHWFCDKLELTGSIYQAVNGAVLTATFFCCRLVWGTYGSIGVFKDVYRAISTGYTTPQYLHDQVKQAPHYGDMSSPSGQTTHFMTVRYLPLWLGACYLTANVVLTVLNFWWFSKMVQTIRKRFDPPFGTKGVGDDKVHYYAREKSDSNKKRR